MDLQLKAVSSSILGVYLSKHRNMLVVESFIRSLVKNYGRYVQCIQTVEEHGIQKHAISSVVTYYTCIQLDNLVCIHAKYYD
jgi:hypothetical protein